MRGASPSRRSDGGQGLQQLLLLRFGQRGEQRADLAARALVERREGLAAGGREGEQQVPGVVLRAQRLHQAALLEAAQQAAQVAGVEIELARQLGRGGAAAVREFPQQARLGERELVSSKPSCSTPMRRV